MLVPLMITLVPGSGLLRLSVTTPLIVCDHAAPPHSRRSARVTSGLNLAVEFCFMILHFFQRSEIEHYFDFLFPESRERNFPQV
jgi:hypothetical protein